MRDEVNQALTILNISVMCVMAFIFFVLEETQVRQIKELKREIITLEVKIDRLEKELKSNDEIVLKLLNREWN